LSALLIAICFHQFFEGLGLGEWSDWTDMWSDTGSKSYKVESVL
jgi:hypothetical protein